ncbi:hypothetical protein L596_025280 [Steinernema carpocapsae]|uniref:Uncharacterized protein n=1 Tax=Steinernema carpocapsae TaxID=34508 RepID=A0A4U5M7B7_STECR|nr:hypothetical protein L596_025280 [Steinernema carpocapsae]
MQQNAVAKDKRSTREETLTTRNSILIGILSDWNRRYFCTLGTFFRCDVSEEDGKLELRGFREVPYYGKDGNLVFQKLANLFFVVVRMNWSSWIKLLSRAQLPSCATAVMELTPFRLVF